MTVAAGDGVHLSGEGDGRVHLARRDITSVAVGDGLWALADGCELHRIGARGDGPVAVLASGVGTCVHVHHGVVLVGDDTAGLWRLEGDALVPVRAFGDAPTRPEWHTPWGGPPAVLSMASSATDVYVNVHVGGILRSGDDGATWTSTIDLRDDVHQVLADPDGTTVWAATGRRGLAESGDAGRTWTHHVDGLHGTYLLAVAVTSAGVLVGASSGHAATDGALYLYDGARFAPVRAGLPDRFHGAIGPRRLAASGSHAALALPDDTVYVSADGGRRWARLGRFDGVREILVTPSMPVPGPTTG